MTEVAQPIHSEAALHGVAQSALSPQHLRMLLLGLGFATGMEFYTADSINLVLTDITGSFGISGDEASWSLTTYSSALFMGVPVCVWLAGHIGHKIYLIGSIVMFAIASVISATSYRFETMLVARAFQGLAGAGLVVWWRGTVYMLLPKPQRSEALMRVSTMLYLSSAFGMLFAGYVTDQVSWRLICVPNLAYAAVAIWLIVRYFPHVPVERSDTSTDWLGIFLIAVTLVSLQVILSRGEIDDWLGSPRIRLLVWLCIASLILFGVWQTSPRNRAPLLRLHLLLDRFVLSSALIGVFTGMILSGSLYMLPEFLRNVSSQPLSATQTGRVMAVYALTAAAARPLVVGVVARLGQRKTICGALVCLIVSMLMINRFLTTDTPPYYFYIPLIFYAFCVCALLPAVGSGTVARIEQQKLLDGVSLYMTFRQFGAALGVAVLTILVERRETLHSSRLFDHLRVSSATVQNWMTTATHVIVSRGGYSMLKSQDVATKLLAEVGGREAATLAYADAFLFMAIIGVVTLCLVPIIPPTPVARK
jgi:MFS transporter, DHA2 family, multidrug resistance protein